jgi:hypothetical protein
MFDTFWLWTLIVVLTLEWACLRLQGKPVMFFARGWGK